MKVVIDIPECVFSACKQYHNDGVAQWAESVIAGGTPLPEGEWIDHSEDYGYVECPFCHKATTCEDNIDELHYCSNCGAEMRKEGAK